MTDESVGYCKPPRHTRFRKGVCPNPKGRGRRETNSAAEAINVILSGKISYQESGKPKRAARAELSIKRLVTSALNGNVKDAELLLKLRKNTQAIAPDTVVIKISGGLP